MEYGFIFDMDGVVIDSNPFHKIAWGKFLKGKGIACDDAYFDNVLSGKTGPTSLRIIFGEDLSESLMEEYLREVDGNYQSILRESEEELAIEGLYDFLASIKGKVYRLGLATSAPPLNIKLGLEKLGLEGVFEVVVGKADVVNGKPHPEVYLTTVERLGLTVDRCVVFEDSKAGVQSALNAGIPVVGIASGHSRKELLAEGVSLAVENFSQLKLEQVTRLINKN
jgi:HAD superfamily hydrolase (TIGR01509 family)